jgi:hypothetical protein
MYSIPSLPGLVLFVVPNTRRQIHTNRHGKVQGLVPRFSAKFFDGREW